MDLRSFLDQSGCRYAWSRHGDAFTARSLASREHVPANHVIKPVLVNIDGEFVLCALPATSAAQFPRWPPPATHRADLSLLQMELGAEETRLANEQELQSLCSDC